MANGGFNDESVDTTSSFEYFPSKRRGRTVYSQFLQDALPSNLFPITYALPNDQIFLAANKLAMICAWRSN